MIACRLGYQSSTLHSDVLPLAGRLHLPSLQLSFFWHHPPTVFLSNPVLHRSQLVTSWIGVPPSQQTVLTLPPEIQSKFVPQYAKNHSSLSIYRPCRSTMPRSQRLVRTKTRLSNYNVRVRSSPRLFSSSRAPVIVSIQSDCIDRTLG